jgi:DNA-binding CsgD family transcriptional regulator
VASIETGLALASYRAMMAGRRTRPEDLRPGVLEGYLPFLERLDAVEGSSVALYDFARGGYGFLTSSFRFLLGYSSEEALARGPDYFFEGMHPEDLGFVLDTVTRALRFLDALPPQERRGYKLNFDYRMRRQDGDYIRLVQQVVVLEEDARGGIWLVLIVNDSAPEGGAETPPSRALVRTRDGSRHLFPPPLEVEGCLPQLTRRELEILGLVAEGLGSKAIADRRTISVATVNNHRQAILEKTGSRNSSEAVSLAARLGLL